MRSPLLLLILPALGACTQPADTGSGSAVVDLTMTAGVDYPAVGPTDISWEMPAFEVPPYTDTQMCLAGTYTGPDVALTTFGGYQQAEYGHHVLLLGTSTNAIDMPDGEFFDCTQTADLPMSDLQPIILPTGGNGEAFGMALPTGIATKLRSGQRTILQVHNVNTSGNTLLVNAIGISNTIPDDQVTDWAAPWTTNEDKFSIPAHSAQTDTFDCTFATPYNMLYFIGHMHEWGTHFKLEKIDPDGTSTTFYEEQWDPAYRDTPPIEDHTASPFVAEAGSVWRTTCEWYNDTDNDLTFPGEMCAAVSMVYPALTADICSD